MEDKSLQRIALDFIETRSEKTFSILYNRLKPGLKKNIQYYHQDPETVDEILAITFSKAYIFADKYDSQWNFSTWIYKICKNECLMEIRRKNTISSLDTMMDSKITINAINDDDWKINPEYEVFSQEEVIQADSLYAEVLEEIKNLPTHYKEILEDRIIHKLKYTDIADKRDLKINTVRSRIHSAKKVIKNLWIEKKRKDNSKTVNIVGVTILQLLGDDEKTVKPHRSISRKEGDIVIVKAKYGAGNTWIDVKDKVCKTLKENKEIKACNRLGGDPCYGSPKALILEYYFSNEPEHVYSDEIKEGKKFKA